MSSGEFNAAFADEGVEPVFETVGELVDIGGVDGVDELRFGSIGAWEEDVFAYGSFKEEVVLQDNAEVASVAGEGYCGEVGAIDGDGALVGVEEGGCEAGNGCFA